MIYQLLPLLLPLIQIQATPIIKGHVVGNNNVLHSAVALIAISTGDGAKDCTGTFIEPNKVLTAAHCIYKMTLANSRVYAGNGFTDRHQLDKAAEFTITEAKAHSQYAFENQKATEEDYELLLENGIKRVEEDFDDEDVQVAYEKATLYKTKSMAYDIAILKVKRVQGVNDDVTITPIPVKFDYNYPTNSQLQVMGWGPNFEGESWRDLKLRSMQITIGDQDKAIEWLDNASGSDAAYMSGGPIFWQSLIDLDQMNKQTFCSFDDPNQQLTTGDSGAPLILMNPVPKVVGIHHMLSTSQEVDENGDPTGKPDRIFFHIKTSKAKTLIES